MFAKLVSNKSPKGSGEAAAEEAEAAAEPSPQRPARSAASNAQPGPGAAPPPGSPTPVPPTGSGPRALPALRLKGVELRAPPAAAAAAGAGLEEEDSGTEAATPHAAGSGDAERSGAEGINVASLDELVLEPEVIEAMRGAWLAFGASAQSQELAGEAIFSAIFGVAPSLQALFVTSRAVHAMRFMLSVSNLLGTLENPAELKMLVETLGFNHLNIEVTALRVAIFRDAILELFEVELERAFTELAYEGWRALLNYAGGAIVFVKSHYAERLSLLLESWEVATHRTASDHETPQAGFSGSHEDKSPTRRQRLGTDTPEGSRAATARASPRGEMVGPKSYDQMFHFNAAVMGLTGRPWLKEVLDSFNAIVTNVANSARLQQECDLLALRISKCKGSAQGVHLAEYRSCMLASLRSLLPKAWDSKHEVAWNWLWENVERLLKKTLGRPLKWEVALDRLLESLGDGRLIKLGQAMYERFFTAAPIGQEYFTLSNTRLNFLVERILMMTAELFHDPWGMADDLSALGLRHVGYGVPTELFGPFVTCCIQEMSLWSNDEDALEGFRWSMGLIAKILTRTIMEGSTIVMKAINVNSVKQLRKAISCAPRGARAQWLLLVQVGTQSISPLAWALDSGRQEAATAILKDLLTIRADRERYYYGLEELFKRHPDIVKKLCAEGPELLGTLLDGLVWRSRATKDGLRRANFYIKYLVVDQEGNCTDALRHLTALKDPTIVCHPAVNIVSDALWSGIVRWEFLYSRVWFMLSLVMFMLGQAILPRLQAYDQLGVRAAVLACRAFNYMLTMMRLVFLHARSICLAYHRQDTKRVMGVPVPVYLLSPFNASTFLLAALFLFLFVSEPMLHCARDPDWPTDYCPAAQEVLIPYFTCSMCAMLLHWLLMVDLAVYSTGLSAFILVITKVLSDISRFMVALLFVSVTFASGICVLNHGYEDMFYLSTTMLYLCAIVLQLINSDWRDFKVDELLLLTVYLFIVVSAIVILNLLIAQLTCSYVYIYQNMVGFARLSRAEVIVETLASCRPAKWQRFVKSLKFDTPLDFSEGDVGMSGGLTVLEPAGASTVTEDTIRRYGGSCAPDMPWPEDVAEEAEANSADKFDRIERLVQRALKNISAAAGGSKKKGSASDSKSSSTLGSTGNDSTGSDAE